MKKYCPVCGNATEYTSSEPDKCDGCGKSFSAAFKVPTIKKSKRRQIIEEDDDEEDDFESDVELPNIKKLSISFEGIADRREKLEDVVREGALGIGSRPVPTVLPKEEWLEARAARLNTTTRIEIGGNE